MPNPSNAPDDDISDDLPPEPRRRNRVSGADILAAIDKLGDRIAGGGGGGQDDEDSSDDAPEGSLPPEVTFEPEPEPVPTPQATEEEVNAPIPPSPVQRRRGFPTHRGRRGRK